MKKKLKIQKNIFAWQFKKTLKIAFSRHQAAGKCLKCNHSNQNRKLHRTVVTNFSSEKSPSTLSFHSFNFRQKKQGF